MQAAKTLPAAVEVIDSRPVRNSSAERHSPSCLNRLTGPSSLQAETAALCRVLARSAITSRRITSKPSIWRIALIPKPSAAGPSR